MTESRSFWSAFGNFRRDCAAELFAGKYGSPYYRKGMNGMTRKRSVFNKAASGVVTSICRYFSFTSNSTQPDGFSRYGLFHHISSLCSTAIGKKLIFCQGAKLCPQG